jgi:hypothetical protein
MPIENCRDSEAEAGEKVWGNGELEVWKTREGIDLVPVFRLVASGHMYAWRFSSVDSALRAIPDVVQSLSETRDVSGIR